MIELLKLTGAISDPSRPTIDGPEHGDGWAIPIAIVVLLGILLAVAGIESLASAIQVL